MSAAASRFATDRRLAWILCVHLCLALPSQGAAADLRISNARLIDGTGAPARNGMSILVRAGRIAEIAADVAADGVATIDAAGATVIPGLIDAHVHNAVIPGSEFRNDSESAQMELRRAHLRGYLAAGVTTILDTGISVALAAEIRRWLAEGHPGPNFFALGPPLTAPGGYGSARTPETTVGSPEDLGRAFDAVQSAGAVGVKVFIETGFGPAEGTMPTHTPAMRAAIARVATERKLPIYAHASSEAEQQMGLDMGAHALVHMNFYTAPPSARFLQDVRRRGTYVMTTFSIMDAELTRWQPERLDDPLLVTVVPELERTTARDPQSGWFEAEAMMGTVLPQLPRLLRKPAAWLFLSESTYRQMLASSMTAAKTLHDAGVPLVIGSDAGNWPIIPYVFHAASTHREIALLAEAGIAPADVLAGATRVPARMLGIAHDVGTVEVGKRADLVIVNGDPLADVRALRNVRWTIKDGVARTPAGWMRQKAIDER